MTEQKGQAMTKVAHLLTDMARSIRVCETTLGYLERSTAAQQAKVEAAKQPKK